MSTLYGMIPDALASRLGCSPREARRILAHTVSRGEPLDTLPRLARRTREAVAALPHEPLVLLDRVVCDDGFVKYLFRSPDGALSEAVRIPLHVPGRYSVCLSSQVGCAMGCDFCATARLGLRRNLEAWEMVAAFLAVRADSDGRVTGAVFMGQGEPFHNYDEVLRAAAVLSHPCGGRIAQRAITISTVGLTPQIRRYTREGHRYRLIVSLTSAIADKRRRLLPVAGRTPLEELGAALRAHAEARGEPVTVAWVLMGGVNDGPDEVAAMRRLFHGAAVRLNLIDLNPTGDTPYRRADDIERGLFRDRLRALAIPVVRRYSGGADKGAACGMLANRHGEICA